MKRALVIASAALCLLALFVVSPAMQATQPAPPVTDAERAALAAEVKREVQHAWSGYRKLAWGHDELRPVSGAPHDWYPPSVVYMTPVDSLDTLLMMGLRPRPPTRNRSSSTN